jgi:hypothetical protein
MLDSNRSLKWMSTSEQASCLMGRHPDVLQRGQAADRRGAAAGEAGVLAMIEFRAFME